MDKINRSIEGVSPVIATILMVAITVVLAATLYAMVDNMAADEGQTPLLGSLNRHDGRTISLSLTTPSRAQLDDVTLLVMAEYKGSNEVIDLRFEDWEDGTAQDGDYTASWFLLSGEDEISSGSRLRLFRNDDHVNFIEFSDFEMILRIDGYSGTISREF